MLGPSSHLVGAIDKLPFISCAKNTTGAHCGEGAVGAQEIASSFDWTSLVLGIVLFMLSQLFLYARELYLDSDEIA